MSGKTGRHSPAPSAKALESARSVFDYGLPVMLGVRVIEIGAERVIAEMRVKREHFNRNGRMVAMVVQTQVALPVAGDC